MENILSLYKENSLNKNIENNLQIEKNKTQFKDIVVNMVDKGADYLIKSSPLSESMKNILVDVKKSLKTNDFKEIVNTAIGSSINEGLKVLQLPKNVIKDISNITKITLKGGLLEGINAGIDIIVNKYFKNNLFFNIIKEFKDKLKGFVGSSYFKLNIENGIDKIVKKTNKYKNICNEWLEAYDKFDLEKINSLAKKLNLSKKDVILNEECIKQNNIIQNITKLVNNKKGKLSNIQLQICNNL